MTKQQFDLLRRISHAREVVKSYDPADAELVKALHDTMLRKMNETEWGSSEEFSQFWRSTTHDISVFLSNHKFVTRGAFFALWEAYDTLAYENALAFS